MDFNLREKVREAYNELLQIEKKESDEKEKELISISLTRKEWRDLHYNLIYNNSPTMFWRDIYTIINKINGKF